jgi:hypothetical protein
MCFGVTAGAYILTLFAVCVSSKPFCYVPVAYPPKPFIKLCFLYCRQSTGSEYLVLSLFHLCAKPPHGLSGYTVR